MEQKSRNPFNSLPIEINQRVAGELEYDSDICTFRILCRSTHDAVDADNFSFWRRRFLQMFDASGWSQEENFRYKTAYQHRKRLLKNGTRFQTGRTFVENECLLLLKELVIESFAEQPEEVVSDGIPVLKSSNLEHVRRFVSSTNLLKILFDHRIGKCHSSSTSKRTRGGSSSDLLHTIQVLCAPVLFSLDANVVYHHFGYPDSQKKVYSTAATTPIFGGNTGMDVNMLFILHNINFWRYHLTREAEQTLFAAFEELEDCERPRFWTQHLQPVSSKTLKLGRRWKGSYAYIQRDEIDSLRVGRPKSGMVQDWFSGEDSAFAFQDITLSVCRNGEHSWPEIFERHLSSLTPPAPRKISKIRAQTRSIPVMHDCFTNFEQLSCCFCGDGKDATETFLAAGRINPLPAQSDIPGWGRMTMMKYFDDDNGTIDESALWAYEGVMLPGGQIILGRWWSPDDGIGDGQYSGPFLLWCVDGPGDDHIDEGVDLE